MTRATTALAAALLALAPAAYAQDPTRVVIPRALIESAGWFTIGEVLSGATGWHRATLDAVSFFASADGLPAGAAAYAGEPEWLVLIDGQRATVDVLGAKLLELLPISPAQVESVTVTRVPRLVAGTIAARGVVEFHTRRGGRGPAFDAAWHSGNITGDPGPYAFTPLATRNVDRLGPYNHAVATFAGAGWDLAAGARQGSSHVTHRGIRELFDPAAFEQLGIHKWAPYDVLHVRVGGDLLGGRHDLAAGRGWVNGPAFLPLVAEQWLRGAFEHAGVSGSVPAGRAALGYQLTRSALDITELPTTFPFVVGHSRDRTSGVLELDVRGDRARHVRLGAATTRWSMRRTDTTAARTDVTLFGRFAATTGVATHSLSAALARSSGGPVTPKAVLSTRMTPDSLTAVAAALGYVQFALGDDGTWIDRILRGLDTLARGRDERLWADLAVWRRLRVGTLDVGARAGVTSGVRVVPSISLPGDPLPLTAGIAEVRAGFALPATARIAIARIAYRYAAALGPDSALRAAVRATPTHTLDAFLVVTPTTDLRLGAFAHVASETQWAEFFGVPPSTTGDPALVMLPATTRLDLSAEKWFWRRRVRTQLLVRNLLDRPERYHPRGAELPLRAHITIALALPRAP